MPIQLLDDNLINKIAAGEVIERPASVVKELVENAMDAGSTRINVQIAGGGLELIEVEDNGSGIPCQDVALALQRHATSKIASEADLFSIDTMGFRGEALPSIASIARLELYTRSFGENGSRVEVDGGIIQKVIPFPGPEGTRIVVKDLFFNTPVRKKFIKSPVSEQNHIYDLMSKLALSRPDISFSLANEKKLYFKTPGNGNLRDALIAINGRDFAEQFIDFKVSGDNYSAEGLLSKPDFHRVNRKNQIFYVNHRLIRSPMLARAVDEGYKGLLLAREYPGVIIFLSLAHADVDINVHPQKSELRFRDESPVFRLISRGIRDTVNGLAFAWGAEYKGLDKPSVTSNPVKHDYEPVRTSFSRPEIVHDQAIPFTYLPPADAPPSIREDLNQIGESVDTFRILGQCFNSYILVELEGKLWMVDQHAAHERIMYNRLKDISQHSGSQSQILALPLTIELSAAEMDEVLNQQALFEEIGLILEALGPETVVIRSSPPALQGQENELLTEILQMLRDNQSGDYKEKALALMACKQAIKAGQILNRREMEQVMRDLLTTDDYRHCPHGRPSFIEITHSELDRRFKR